MIFLYVPEIRILERLGFSLRPDDWRRLWGDFREFFYARLTFADAASYERGKAKLVAAAKDGVQIVHERRPA